MQFVPCVLINTDTGVVLLYDIGVGHDNPPTSRHESTDIYVAF